MLRELTRDEISVVSGGAEVPDPDEIVVVGSRNYWVTSISGEDWAMMRLSSVDFTAVGNLAGPLEGGGYDPTTADSDGDGIPDAEDEIVVTATPMTPEQRAAYDHHRQVATLTYDGLYLSVLGRIAYAGYAGWAGVGGALSAEAMARAREQAINNMADLNYRRDGADGSYDGHIDPGYITGDKPLPQP